MSERMRWGGTALALALALLLAGLFAQHSSKESAEDAARPVAPAARPPGVVEVSPERQRKMGLEVRPATTAPVRNSLRLTGEITDVPGTQVAVTSPVSGRIVAEDRAGGLTIGSEVKKGQLLTVVESYATGTAGLSTEAQLKQEEANYARVQADWERAQQLYAAGLIARKDLQQAEADYRATEGRLQALRKQSRLYRELELSRGEEHEPGRFWVRAPIGGVLSDWKIAPGQTVAADEPLATITNTASVVAEANLFVDDLTRVRPGEPATCTSEAFPGKSFEGTISYIGPQTEPGTRVVPVRFNLPNPAGTLRLGMPVEVRIETGPARQAVLVPRDAVIFEEGLQVLYVQVASDQFERRVVRLGESLPTQFEVRDGLRAGERVVTRGAFLLKAEALKGSLPPPPEAGEEEPEERTP